MRVVCALMVKVRGLLLGQLHALQPPLHPLVDARAADSYPVDCETRWLFELVVAAADLAMPAVDGGLAVEQGAIIEPIRLLDLLAVFRLDVLGPDFLGVVDVSIAIKNRELFPELNVALIHNSSGLLPSESRCTRAVYATQEKAPSRTTPPLTKRACR